MKVASASLIKGTSSEKSIRGLPAEGSLLRELYDLYYEYRGKDIPTDLMKAHKDKSKGKTPIKRWNFFHSSRRQLIDYYGCDIRNDVLIGEWFGRVYIDYTQPAEEQARLAS